MKITEGLTEQNLRDCAAGRNATSQDEPHIIDRLTAFLNRFVAFPEPEQATVCALWVLHTYAFEQAYATPYLYVNSRGASVRQDATDRGSAHGRA
jgi:hypothetical protein